MKLAPDKLPIIKTNNAYYQKIVNHKNRIIKKSLIFGLKKILKSSKNPTRKNNMQKEAKEKKLKMHIAKENK